MPIVADELGDLAALRLGLLGVLPRQPRWASCSPAARSTGCRSTGRSRSGSGCSRAGSLIGGLAPSMPVLVARAVRPGPRRRRGRADRLRRRSAAACRTASSRGCSRLLSTAWVVPGIIGPAIAGVVGELASWRWVFLGLLPLLVVAGGLRGLGALRRVEGAPIARRPSTSAARRPSAGSRDASLAGGRRRPASSRRLGATHGPSLARRRRGASAGLDARPGFRRLTPTGTLLLAVGVPAAVLLRGVMTFAFFSGDAYVPLLLQTWRGTPATLTGLVFTATTVAWTAGTWFQARAGSSAGARAASSALGLRVHRDRGGAHDRRRAPCGPARDRRPDLDPPGDRHGLHVLGGHARRAPRRAARPSRGAASVGPPALGHPGHGARDRGRRRDHGGGGAGGRRRPRRRRSPPCSDVAREQRCSACSGSRPDSGPFRTCRSRGAAAVD